MSLATSTTLIHADEQNYAEPQWTEPNRTAPSWTRITRIGGCPVPWMLHRVTWALISVRSSCHSQFLRIFYYELKDFLLLLCVCVCVCVCVCIFSFAIFIVTITVYMKIKTCKLSVTVFFVCLVVVFFFGFCFIMVLFYWWKKTFLHWIGVSGLHFLEALEKKFQYVPQKYKLFFKNVMKQNCTFYQRNRCVSHTNSVGRHFGNDFKSMGQMA